MTDIPTLTMTISSRTDLVVTDPLKLIDARWAQWDALTDAEIRVRGFTPEERFTVFLNELVEHAAGPDDVAALPGVTLRREDWDADWRWSAEDNAALLVALEKRRQHCHGQTTLV